MVTMVTYLESNSYKGIYEDWIANWLILSLSLSLFPDQKRWSDNVPRSWTTGLLPHPQPQSTEGMRTLAIVFISNFHQASLQLCSSQLGVRQYVRCLEETAILACAEFGIQAHTTEHTGVWVEGYKICAIGQ